jgi:hypothetical protein
MEGLRSGSRCNKTPEKQHNLPNNELINNTIIKLLTYSINPDQLRGLVVRVSDY